MIPRLISDCLQPKPKAGEHTSLRGQAVFKHLRMAITGTKFNLDGSGGVAEIEIKALLPADHTTSDFFQALNGPMPTFNQLLGHVPRSPITRLVEFI